MQSTTTSWCSVCGQQLHWRSTTTLLDQHCLIQKKLRSTPMNESKQCEGVRGSTRVYIRSYRPNHNRLQETPGWYNPTPLHAHTMRGWRFTALSISCCHKVHCFFPGKGVSALNCIVR
jgi:hypothetical protein